MSLVCSPSKSIASQVPKQYNNMATDASHRLREHRFNIPVEPHPKSARHMKLCVMKTVCCMHTAIKLSTLHDLL